MVGKTPNPRKAKTKASLLADLESAEGKIAELEAELARLRDSAPAAELPPSPPDSLDGPTDDNFRGLIEESLQAIFVRQDHKAVFANQAYADMCGYDSPENLIGGDHQNLVAPEDREWMGKIRAARFKGEDVPARYQYRGIHKDGSTIWIDGTRQLITWQGMPAVLVTLSDITAQRQAEAQVHEHANQLQQVFDAIPYILILKDKEGRYVLVNRAVCEFWNLTREELIGKNSEEISFGTVEEREDITASDRETLRGDKPIRWYPQTVTDSKGIVKTFNTAKSPIKNSAGEVTGLVAAGLEITEQMQAEDKLRESEERVRTFMDSTTDTFAIFDENLILLELSEPARGRWGGAREQMLGLHMSEAFPGPDQPERQEQYREVLRTGQPIEFDGYLDTPQEGRVYVRHKAFPVGKGLAIINTDLTDLKRAQEELNENAERFRAIAEATPYAMFIVNKEEGRWLYANPMAREMFGLGEEIGEVFATDAY